MTEAIRKTFCRDGAQDFELNLASIIDCFTVLITFMLASASFISIGILDAGITAGGTVLKESVSPEVILTIELKNSQTILIKTQGKKNHSDEIVYEKLSQSLLELKSHWPNLSSATLIAENQIEYQDVVKTMDQIRKIIPAVMLGGF